MATLIGCGKAKVGDLINASDDFEYIALNLIESKPEISTGPEVDTFFKSICSDPENMKVIDEMRKTGMDEEHIKSRIFNMPRYGKDNK